MISFLVYLNNQILKVMLFVVTIAVLLSGWAWYAALVHYWFLFLLLSIISISIFDMQQNVANEFLNAAYDKMKPTECCALAEHFKYPRYVLRTTVALRALAGLGSVAAIVITWFCRTDFAKGSYVLVSGSWGTVSVVWILSSVPMIVSLMQCASVTSDDIIIQYRKTISVWIVHDVFLGVFWLYLSVMLYDLSDDNDDSEWRTIFLSMISWHIIILILKEIYTRPRQQESISICGPENIQLWLRFFLLLSFVGMYVVVSWRMQDNNLIEMGMPLSSLILFATSVMIGYYCKSDIVQVRPTAIQKRRTSQNKLQF